MATKDISDVQVINACIKNREDDGVVEDFAIGILMRETGQPKKVCYNAMERAANRDYIDYGISVRTAWPTEKGYALINDINT
jgi:hypothetical protein